MLVFRTWTAEDIKKACEGLPPYKTKPGEFVRGMLQLQTAYHLNGVECQQALMCALGADWARVRGNWNPMTNAVPANPNVNPPVAAIPPEPLPHDGADLQNRLMALLNRVTDIFQARPNYSLIGQTKQKEGETCADFRNRFEAVFEANSGLQDDGQEQGPYQQQLKQALCQALRPEIAGWIRKHYVDFPTATLSQFMNHAIHAEQATSAKKKKQQQAMDAFWQDMAEDICYVGQGYRGRGRGIGRGRFIDNFRTGQRGRGRGEGRQDREQDEGCWTCGSLDHWSKECPMRTGKDWLGKREGREIRKYTKHRRMCTYIVP